MMIYSMHCSRDFDGIVPLSLSISTFQAYCVTEPGAGSDVAGIKTRAEKKGDEVGVKLIVSE